MYREAGSVSVLSGVPSGPYTGARRVIDASLLEISSRERLEQALLGQSEPTPIAFARSQGLASLHPALGIAVALSGLIALTAVGTENCAPEWVVQPAWVFVLYLALGALFGVSVIGLLRRRRRFNVLPSGRYLFPLDALEVAGNRVTVWPLGSARDAKLLTSKGRFPELVIRFDGGESLTFPVVNDPTGERTLRRLEHAQRLIEELTYKSDLEHAFANDLFFVLRVDKSWDEYAPGGSAARLAAKTPSFIGERAWMVVAGLALLLGGSTYTLRQWVGHVVVDSREESDRLEALREEEAKKPKPAEDFGPQPDDPDEIARRDTKCIQGLESRAATAPKGVTDALVEVVDHAKTKDDRVVMVDFSPTASYPPHTSLEEIESDYFDLNLTLPAMRSRLLNVFNRVLSETCSADTLVFREGSRNTKGAHLDIDEKVQWSKDSWPGDAGSDGKNQHKATFVFDVHFIDILHHERKSFTLTMTPPAAAPTTLRPQSIFQSLDERTPNFHVYSALTARAYDRLYDEIWSLFFSGDPRVPTKPSAVLQP
jgi:hypothetical protein